MADLVEDYDEALPEILCHRAELCQAVLNLLENAANAIAHKLGSARGQRGEIVLSTLTDQESIVIAMSDNGCGIPVSQQGAVFDPFFTTHDVGDGRGQGLSTAYAIVVEKHGGEISFTSREDEGTTFFVRIPIQGVDD